MRKLLVFLLLFGAGLGWLLWRQQQNAKPEDPPEPVVEETRPFTEVGMGVDPKGRQQAVGVLLDGPLEFVERATINGRTVRALDLQASDVDSLDGGRYLLKDLQIGIHDVEADAPRAQLKAPRATVTLSTDSGSPQLDRSVPVDLEGVIATLLRGAPIVPLRVESPSIQWTPGEDRYSSTEAVLLSGKGMKASGLGFDARPLQGTIGLLRAASLSFELEAGGAVTLASGVEEGIDLRRLERVDGAYLELTAKGGARMVVTGARPTSMDSRTITLLGRLGSDDQPFQLVSVVADGTTVAEHQSDVFRADRAEFFFGANNTLQRAELLGTVVLESRGDQLRSEIADFRFAADGTLDRAVLTGSPRGLVNIARLSTETPERVELEGLGPLTLTRGATADLLLGGPATLTLTSTGVVLRAKDLVEGHVAADGSRGSLLAKGDVVMTRGGEELQSEDIELLYATTTAPAERLRFISRGRTSLSGRTPQGELVVARAQGGLQGTVGEQNLRVSTAREVRMELGQPPTLVAQARLLRAFDAAARTLEASGDVLVESPQGVGTADELSVRGPEEVELRGTPGRPARWQTKLAGSAKPDSSAANYRAVAEAEFIKAQPQRLEARGAVVAQVVTQKGALDLTSGVFVVALADPGVERALVVTAEHTVHAVVGRDAEQVVLDADYLRLDGRMVIIDDQEVAIGDEVVAQRGVRVAWQGAQLFEGAGERFWMHRDGRMRLDAPLGGRLLARGVLDGTNLSYEATATWIERQVQPQRIEIDQPLLQLSSDEAGALRGGGRERGTVLRKVRGSRLRVDATSIVLDGAQPQLSGLPAAPGRAAWDEAAALLEGWDETGAPWIVRAGSIRLRGDFRDDRVLKSADIQALVAQGGFEARLDNRIAARGDRLDGVPGRVRFEGRPAVMSVDDSEWESDWIQYDLQNLLLSTDAGELRSRTGATGTSWSLQYDSLQPYDQQDATILVMKNPRARGGARQMRADWILLWIDRQKWRTRGLRMIEEGFDKDPLLRATEATQQRVAFGPFADLARHPLAGVVSEVYIEGNLEFYDQGERDGRASAVYIDLVEMHGWIQDGDIALDLNVRDNSQQVRIKAEWLRISSTPKGPALRAASAVLTSCGFDDPHYVIETGDLRLNPQLESKDERVAYSVAARSNSIRFANGFKLPLPAIVFETDERGNPLVDRLVLGNSARLGASIRASINADLGFLGLGIGKVFSNLVGLPSTDIRGSWNYDVGLLGSRGVLLGAALDLQVAKKFRMLTSVDVIPDGGTDRGLLRVDKDDRGLLRTWLHARGRYDIDTHEWIDVVGSLQSDPGVQSEFFENDYLAYEEKDTYLHWRKSRGTNYYSGSAKFVIEDRTDTEELPSVGAYVGRNRIGQLFGQDLYWVGTVDAAYLRRLEGDPAYATYAGYKPYADGLGEREVMRIAADQRIEAPFSVGAYGLRATPFVQASARAWDSGIDPDETPARAALITGAELSTTLWKRSPRGAIHTITPNIGWSTDIGTTSTESDPVYFDPTEFPLNGTVTRAGVRTRWSSPASRERFDADARIERRIDLDQGGSEETLPLLVLGEYLTWFGEVPVGVSHDGRYDLRDGTVPYSRTALGFEPTPSLGFEFSYAQGLDATQDPLFEAVSGAMRWRWTTKWEMQLQQSISLLEDAGLGNEFVLRRMGHDFVAEFEIGYRAGEGSSFGINILPRLSWRRSRLGLLDTWLGLYH